MKLYRLGICCLLIITMSCNENETKELNVEVFETSESGNQLTQITEFTSLDSSSTIKLLPEQKLQTITGFGGAFTESSAYLLNKLSKKNRDTIMKAYFSEDGANYVGRI